jgi:AcrR family transcriptional regulator
MNDMDMRVVKTIEGIRESFLQCLQEVGFAHMTVKDITQRARIKRSTFYAHYKDKYDLRDKYVDSVIQDFVEKLDIRFIVKKEIKPLHMKLMIVSWTILTRTKMKSIVMR